MPGAIPGLAGALLSPSKILSLPGASGLETRHPLMGNPFAPSDDPSPTLRLCLKRLVSVPTEKSPFASFLSNSALSMVLVCADTI